MYNIWNWWNLIKKILCKSIVLSFFNLVCIYNKMFFDICMMLKIDKVVKSNSDICIRENYILLRVERVFWRLKIKRLLLEWEFGVKKYYIELYVVRS